MEYQKAKARQEDGNQSESAEPRPVAQVPRVELPGRFLEMTDVVHGLVERVGALEDHQAFVEMIDVVKSLVERVGAIEDLHAGPEPEAEEPRAPAGAPVSFVESVDAVSDDDDVPGPAAVETDDA